MALRRQSRTDDLGDRVVERLPGPVAAVVRRIRQEDVLLLAAGLAFYALVSAAPFAILILWILSLAAGDDSVHQLADLLGRRLPPDLQVGQALERVATLGAGLGLGAFIALLWPATAYGSGLSRAFERLSPGSDRPAKGLRGRALALGLVGIMPALVLVGLIASYVGTSFVGRGLLGSLLGWFLAVAFGFVASGGAAIAIYKLFSPTAIGRRGLLHGGAMAGATISLLSAGYAVFLNFGADFQNRYASSSLAAVVLLAVWMFLANALILVGYQVALEVD